MSKLKTHSGAKKRFKVTAKKKIKAAKSNRRHILTSKSTKSKRQARRGKILFKADQERVLKLLLAN